LLEPEEKDALDDWYIRNASFWLDLHILFLTVQCVFRGERRGDAAIAEAFAMRRRQSAAEVSEHPVLAGFPVRGNPRIPQPVMIATEFRR
jgi:Bacterial sugar transferase